VAGAQADDGTHLGHRLVPGGLDIDDAVEIARAFAEHGADAIDVSTGQVVSDEKPAFGRSYQTPYADRIRNEIGTSTASTVIAVGAISSYDDVNSIILAGRADLCALGRTHLYDPQWTLHAAAEQELRPGPGAVSLARLPFSKADWSTLAILDAAGSALRKATCNSLVAMPRATNGLASITVTKSRAERTSTATSIPKSARIAAEIACSSDAACRSLDSKMTLPLCPCVRTFVEPREMNELRRSAMAIRLACPTLMPRNRATHVALTTRAADRARSVRLQQPRGTHCAPA
jgi:hypothetical protein